MFISQYLVTYDSLTFIWIAKTAVETWQAAGDHFKSLHLGSSWDWGSLDCDPKSWSPARSEMIAVTSQVLALFRRLNKTAPGIHLAGLLEILRLHRDLQYEVAPKECRMVSEEASSLVYYLCRRDAGYTTDYTARRLAQDVKMLSDTYLALGQSDSSMKPYLDHLSFLRWQYRNRPSPRCVAEFSDCVTEFARHRSSQNYPHAKMDLLHQEAILLAREHPGWRSQDHWYKPILALALERWVTFLDPKSHWLTTGRVENLFTVIRDRSYWQIDLSLFLVRPVFLLRNMGRAKDAFDVTEETLLYLRKEKRWKGLARIHCMRGILLRAMERHDEAEQEWDKAYNVEGDLDVGRVRREIDYVASTIQRRALEYRGEGEAFGW